MFYRSVLFLFCLALHGQDPSSTESLHELTLDQLLQLEITTVSKTGTPINKAPGIVSVITGEELANLGAENLGEALNLVTGFEIQRAIMFGVHQTVGVRGRAGDFGEDVLIMLDGQRLNEVYTGGGFHQIKQMNTAHISRIELIKGPGSPMYGSNAFAGIVNIFTHHYHSREDTRLSITGGGDGKMGADVALRAQLGRAKIILTGNWTEDDGQTYHPETGFLRIPGQIPPASDPIQAHTDVGFGLSVGEFQLNVDYFDRKLDGFMPWGFWDRTWESPILDTNRDDSRQIRLKASYAIKVNDRLTLTPSIKYLEGRIRQLYFLAQPGLPPFSPGTGVETYGWFGSPSHDTDNRELEVQANYQSGNHQITAGVLYQEERLTEVVNNFNFFPFPTTLDQVDYGPEVHGFEGAESYADLIDRNISAFYVQDTWNPTEKLGVTGGLRYDKYSDYGDALSPRLALVYNQNDNLTYKLLYGNAFRAPTFNELYVRNNPVQRGNDSLDAQTMDTYEVHVSYLAGGRALVSGSLFYSRYQDLIQLVNMEPLPTYFNASEDESDLGFEAEVKLKWAKDGYFFAGYAYIDAEDANHMQRAFIARHKGNMVLNCGWKNRWSLNLNAFYHGDREIPAGAGRVEMDAVLVAGLNLRVKNLFKALDLNLGVFNAGDEDWDSPGYSPVLTPENVPNRGRYWRARLTWRL